MNERNPFGKAQSEMFRYILTHPGCSFNDIWQACFPDKQAKYLHNLIHENQGFISKTESINTEFPSQYWVKIPMLNSHIDIAHYVKTGKFKAKYVQQTIPFNDDTSDSPF